MDPIQLSDGQERVLQAAKGCSAVLVTGNPGTGKTTALVESVVRKVASGVSLSEIVVLTHVRSSAQQLRRRIIARLGASVLNPHITTPYGLCLSIQSRFSSPQQLPTLLTTGEQLAVVQDLLAESSVAWPETLHGGLRTLSFAAEIREIAAKARQLGLDPQQVTERGASAGRPEWEAVGLFLDEYLDVLDALGSLDYSELVHRTRLLVRDSGVEASLRSEIKAVYCDEFAEFDPAQVKLLADLARIGIPVVAFADPTTRVSDFRGSDPSGVRSFDELFPGAHRISLDKNLRSSPGVVAAQNRLLARLGQPVELSDVVDDSVRAVACPDYRAEIKQVAASLRAERLAGKEWSEMAVINRAASGEVTLLAKALEREGIPVQLSGDSLPLSDQPAVRVLLAALKLVLDLCTESNDPVVDESTIIDLLHSPLCGVDAVDLRQLGRLLRQSQEGESVTSAGELSSTKLIVQAVLAPARLKELLSSTGLVTHSGVKTVKKVLEFGVLVQQAAKMVVAGTEISAVVWHLWNGTPWPKELRAEALSVQRGSSRANRDLDAVIEFFDFLPKAGNQTGVKALRNVLLFMENQQIANDNQRESQLGGTGVSILTAHRTKGQSWSFVVLVSVEEGNWPKIRTKSPILAVSELDGESLTTLSYQEQIAAERRLFLLGLSRASEKVLITALDATSEDSLGVSRFVAELGVDVHQIELPEVTESSTDFIGRLRRTTTSPSVSPALRLAAAKQLAELAKQRDNYGDRLFPAADPASWWGYQPAGKDVPPSKIRVGVTAIEELTRCPRRYFLSRMANRDEPVISATMGSIFHELAERRQAGDLTPVQVQETLDKVFKEIQVKPEWKREFERTEADQMMARFEAWLDGRTDECVGNELEFTVMRTFPDLELEIRGKVDRLELTADRKLRIVDFKTGNSILSEREAAANVQLGLYQLAITEGCFTDVSDGSQTPADPVLVYVRKNKKATERSQQSLGDVNPATFYRSKEGELLSIFVEAFDSDGNLTPEASSMTWIELVLRKVAQIIQSQDFRAIRNKNCRACGFQLGCPAFVKGNNDE